MQGFPTFHENNEDAIPSDNKLVTMDQQFSISLPDILINIYPRVKYV